jgi:hypothetical protein
MHAPLIATITLTLATGALLGAGTTWLTQRHPAVKGRVLSSSAAAEAGQASLAFTQARPAGSAALQESQALEEAEHRRLLAAHRTTPVTEAWADAATAKLTAGLQPLAKDNDFEIKDIDCRSKSCTVTVLFPNYARAIARWSVLMSSDAECGSRVTLSTPRDPTQPYATTALYRWDSPREPGRL